MLVVDPRIDDRPKTYQSVPVGKTLCRCSRHSRYESTQ